MQRTFSTLMALLLVLMMGCSIRGKWSLASIEPEAARRDFEYSSLTLQKDGSFYAESQTPVVSKAQVQVRGDGSLYAGSEKKQGVLTSSGTYRFRDDTLTLIPHDGRPVTYAATFKDANHLRLEKFWRGQKVKTVFERVE